MCRVNSFLGCVMLETFGLFVGWFGMILTIIVTFLSILGIVIFIIEQNGIGVVVCISVLIVFFLIACICKELISGVETRDHKKVFKFKFLCILGVFFLCLQLLNVIVRISEYRNQSQFPSGGGLFSSVVSLVFQIYIFICIDSLYKKFEEEKFPQSMMIPPSPYIVDYQSHPHHPYMHTHDPVYPPVPTAPHY